MGMVRRNESLELRERHEPGLRTREEKEGDRAFRKSHLYSAPQLGAPVSYYTPRYKPGSSPELCKQPFKQPARLVFHRPNRSNENMAERIEEDEAHYLEPRPVHAKGRVHLRISQWTDH